MAVISVDTNVRALAMTPTISPGFGIRRRRRVIAFTFFFILIATVFLLMVMNTVTIGVEANPPPNLKNPVDMNEMEQKSKSSLVEATLNSEEKKWKIAIGMISVAQSDRPVYIYPTIQSIYEAFYANNLHEKVAFDTINVFVGNSNETYLNYFQYSKRVKVHPINQTEFDKVQTENLQHKVSYNYGRGLRYMHEMYKETHDFILMFEDDVILHPNAANMISMALEKILEKLGNGNIKEHLFTIDGYDASFQDTTEVNPKEFLEQIPNDQVSHLQENEKHEKFWVARCCTQSFLYSIKAAETAYPIILKSLEKGQGFSPFDILITSKFAVMPGFSFWRLREGWAQHIGRKSNGLGFWHEGSSTMKFSIA